MRARVVDDGVAVDDAAAVAGREHHEVPFDDDRKRLHLFLPAGRKLTSPQLMRTQGLDVCRPDDRATPPTKRGVRNQDRNRECSNIGSLAHEPTARSAIARGIRCSPGDLIAYFARQRLRVFHYSESRVA